MDEVVGQSSSNRGSRGWLNPRNLIIAVVILAVLVIGSVVFWQHNNATAKQTAKVNAAIAASETAYSKNDYTNALNIMGGEAEKATSKAQKARVYQMQAQAAAGKGDLAAAVHYYELKHRADPGTIKPDAYALGTLYERLGQNDNALAQYKIALEYARAQNKQYASDVPAIQASIDQLGKQQ